MTGGYYAQKVHATANANVSRTNEEVSKEYRQHQPQEDAEALLMMEYVWVGVILVTLMLTAYMAVRDLRSESVTAASSFFATVTIGGIVIAISAVGLAVSMFM